ncbi:DUF2493 domain-containing protein [Hyphococcus luteus]|uniref:YspA cpYpsA-related SLOG domain-containing protein n=1 Tax=Hyphococcus luteus TaxID=2058213 RepID=A0A2S7K9R8_9PROT|nr:DUF2493 domain-containing protein [Marinicaulis flavus]PQA89245.1 hypothetical protein CW354_04730 [Marinicaulis flavus]
MQSPTARILENLALFGPGAIAPEDDPLDDNSDVAGAIEGLVTHAGDALQGTPLEAYADDIAWGLVNLFHRKADWLERDLREAESLCQSLIRSQDGSEARSVELERATQKARALAAHIGEFENMRDRLADEFAALTGSSWRPRSGVKKGRPGVTAAIIEARDFIDARRARECEARAPKGPLIAFSGGADWTDADAIFRVLDKVRARHPDMVLAHTAQARGADLVAARWADARKVDQVAFRPHFERHGRAAPFRRNDEMIAAGLAGCVIFPGNGVTLNLGQKAEKAGVFVLRCGFDRRA